MIHFVGAGSGAPDLITVRGQKFLREADVVIYAGSLVNPELLKETKPGCEILNSAYMTLDEVIRAMEKAEREGKMTVRLHTGDPAIYGAIREQMDRLDELWQVGTGLSPLQLHLPERRRHDLPHGRYRDRGNARRRHRRAAAGEPFHQR